MLEAFSNTGLTKTKYYRPGINKNLISRQDLHQKLNNSLNCKYTLITAPAGYGKTSAVLGWLETGGWPAAWLSLDSHDNDPVVFWRYVCTALGEIVKDISKDVDYVFSSQELLKAHIHINIMIDRLSEAPSDFLFVLDDLHLVVEPFIIEGLSYLIDYLPAQMHLIMISRAEPGLEIAKHKVKWQILQIEEEDLRFQNEDIFHFYQARGFTLEREDVKKIENYSEGWAAVLVAIAMSMEKEAAGHNTYKVLSHASRDIRQYLKDEVISTWPEEKRTFAMKTCILGTLSESLCDAVTGDNNGRRMLEEINKGNGFLIALDEQRQEYRYHQLFKSFLYELLMETAPLEVASLHTRAAIWFREHGFIENAIEHFLAGGSNRKALELIEYHVDDIIDRNEFGTLLSWIDNLPEEYRSKSFKIACIYAMYYAETDRYDLSRMWIERMKALIADYEYASSPELNSYRRVAYSLTEAYLAAREGKSDCLSLVMAAAEMNDNGYFKMPEFYDFNPADIYYYRCPFGRALRVYGENLVQYGNMADHYRSMISKNPGYKQLGPGEYFYETNRLEKALPCLLEALEEAQAASCPGALVPAMVDIARINRVRGDMKSALAVVDECEIRLQSMGKPHWNYLLQAFRCRLNIDAGVDDKVEDWLASCKLNTFTEISRSREFELIVYARVLMSRGRLNDANLLLQRLLAFTGDTARLHSKVEILNLLASLAYKNNNMPGAADYLEISLEIGMKEGYVRSYMDEGTQMAHLLRYYTTHRRKSAHEPAEALTGYAKSLLRQMQESLPVGLKIYNEASIAAIENLTEQEKKVLELLMKAHTNKEICEKIGIGIRTVKTHTGNIYSKLGVKNRAQCVKLVRETQLPN
ncbi:MAG TPA: LuxR C-terminal-related transcriptional regulator [Syntrophomonadaceae bacterium]|nr:LuxR C-terminal-related transcriptional regulator [Syntrophomonadaceae bacterium]